MMRRALPLVALGLAACVGTDVGNPIVDVDVALHGEPPASRAAAARPGGAGAVSIHSAWVSIERVRLRSGDCSGDAALELTGPFAVDLLAAGAPPMLSGIELPAADYCRFELRWRPHEGAEGPDSLAGQAIAIEGNTATQTPFVITSDRGDELRLDAEGGSFPVDDATYALVVGLDAAALLDGIDFESAEVGPEGTIVIGGESNPELSEIFEQNVREASRLYDDDDGDGVLDADESEPDDALAR